ncbi:MAG: MerR family transcriptional regulator [Candidatus Binatia bacterium]
MSGGIAMHPKRDSKLSLEELARGTAARVERLREWRSLGLIGAGTEEGFSREDVERVRLIQAALRRGIGPDAIARAEKSESGFLRRYLDQLFPGGIGPTYSPGEAAAMSGLSIELVQRLWAKRSPERSPASAPF